jgi:acyl-[acyl carrier protein]--UDP-N-acetylglucosamine O-acyltransferase
MSIKRAYKALYRNGLKLDEAIAVMRSEQQPETDVLAEFLSAPGRGILR